MHAMQGSKIALDYPDKVYLFSVCFHLMYKFLLCSCLIARNLLSGLKTCIEVSNYMCDGGATTSHRSVAPSSILEDNGKPDTDYMVCAVEFQHKLDYIVKIVLKLEHHMLKPSQNAVFLGNSTS